MDLKPSDIPEEVQEIVDLVRSFGLSAKDLAATTIVYTETIKFILQKVGILKVVGMADDHKAIIKVSLAMIMKQMSFDDATIEAACAKALKR